MLHFISICLAQCVLCECVYLYLQPATEWGELDESSAPASKAWDDAEMSAIEADIRQQKLKERQERNERKKRELDASHHTGKHVHQQKGTQDFQRISIGD